MFNNGHLTMPRCAMMTIVLVAGCAGGNNADRDRDPQPDAGLAVDATVRPDAPGTDTGPAACIPRTINDSVVTGSDYFQYMGSWVASTGEDKHEGDDHYSLTPEDVYIVRFEGTQIDLYATVAPHHGIAAVALDDGVETDVDFYAPTRQDSALVYRSPQVSDGPHALRVRVTGRSHPASTGIVITADRADICAGGTVADAGTPAPDAGYEDAAVADAGFPTDGGLRDTFYVQGRHLYDPCGERIVLRGVNAGNAFPSDPTSQNLTQVTQTGANAVRITYRMIYNNSGAAEVEAGLSMAIANGMVAIPALWDATGDWSQLGATVDFWTSPDVAAVLRRHESHTLLNIANEAGDGSVSNAQFREGYANAIQRIRQAGLRMPLVIDAANWGRNEQYIVDNGAYLLQQDPERNIVFSWHPWDTDQPGNRYPEAMDAVINAGLCMIVGEVSQIGVFYSRPIDYQLITATAQARDIGWLWWWWYNPDVNDLHSLTTNGMYGSWANVGQEICVTGTNSIQNTSVRTRFLSNRGNSCD